MKFLEFLFSFFKWLIFMATISFLVIIALIFTCIFCLEGVIGALEFLRDLLDGTKLMFM